jgi:group I intron endonuclease
MFYVYIHIRKDTGNVFYVGKGRGQRMFQKKGRNPLWINIVNKHGYEVVKIADNLTEEQAFDLEKEKIAEYRNAGYELANMTDGGEGSSGYKHTEEHKAKLKGNGFGHETWGLTFLGKKHTAESKAKMSYARMGNSNKKGKKISEEGRKRISESKLGKPVLARRVLTPEQVKEIRAELGYRNIARLARKYSVGESTIRRIRDGESYKDS